MESIYNLTNQKREISCQNSNLKKVYTNCIYRKIHKKAKRTNYSEWFALFQKIISYEFFGDNFCGIFEDRKSSSL